MKNLLPGWGVKLSAIAVVVLIVLALCGAELDYDAIDKWLADFSAWKDEGLTWFLSLVRSG